MISAQQASVWTRTLLAGVALLGVFFAIGYGLMGLFVVMLLLAAGGVALLHWIAGKTDD